MSKEIFKKVVANDPKALAEIKLAVLNGLDIKYEIDEATNYEIKDNKVLITKDNYNKKHKDYKSGKKGEEKLLVLDPKSGGTVLMPVKFIDEAIDEAKVYNRRDFISYLKKFNIYGENIDSKFKKNEYIVTIEYFDDSDAKAEEKRIVRTSNPELEKYLTDYEVDGNILTLKFSKDIII